MADEDLRRRERAAAQGDPEAEAQVLAARLRAGHCREGDLRLAAWLGHPAARRALGDGFDPRPEWWDEDLALEHWIMHAGAHAGVWETRSSWSKDGKVERITAFIPPSPEDRRAETFHLTALLCVTGYWLGRMALLEEGLGHGEWTAGYAPAFRGVVRHEDPPGWRVVLDMTPPAGVDLGQHLTGLGYLDDEMLHTVTDINQRAVEALHPDYARVAPWRWDPPDFWFPEDGGYIPMMALCTCGHQYQSHAVNEVGDDVCEECSCIRFESSGRTACGTFGGELGAPAPLDPSMPAHDAAAYFAAEAERLVCFREPVRERLRANLCFWAIGSYTPTPTVAKVIRPPAHVPPPPPMPGGGFLDDGEMPF